MTMNLTKPALTLLVALVAAAPWSRGLAQKPDDEELLQPPLVEAALRAEGHAFEALTTAPEGLGDPNVEPPRYAIRFREPPTYGFLSGEGLTLATRYPGVAASPERINLWNRERRFSSAYRDRTGAPVVASALAVPLASRGALRQFFEVYQGTLDEFEAFLKAEPAPRRPGGEAPARGGPRRPQLGIWGVPAVVHPPGPPPTPPGEPQVVGPGSEPPMDGIRITAVAPGSPAEKAGVRPDDVIVGATTEKDPLANFSNNTPDVPALLKVLDQTRNFLWLMVARGGAYQQVEPVRVRFGKDPPDA
jgi:hypothetical protein